MNKEIVIDNEFVEGSYVPEYKLVQIIWKLKTIPSEIYRSAFTYMLDYTDNRKVVNFLSDGRLSGAINTDDRKWFQTYAVPRAEKNGLKHGAMVIKQDPFKKYYMNAILKFASMTVSYNLKIFYDYDEALKWLLSYNDFQ